MEVLEYGTFMVCYWKGGAILVTQWQQVCDLIHLIIFFIFYVVFNSWKCKVKRLNVLFCFFFPIGCLIWGLVIIFLFCGFVFSLLWNFGLEIGNIHHHELKAIEFNNLNVHFVIYVIWLVVLSLGDNEIFFNCSNFLTINNQQ